ncbi:glycerophosphodiester phosphodiesterase [Flavihumibacter sp. R14]|nr:glycerophosphodiester phosphodiesterase [Flavihumibacter soli]
MKHRSFYSALLLFSCILLFSCKSSHLARLPRSFPEFYKEGHRGARGLMPENTIQAMIRGIEAGANVIEVDVYTTKDSKLVVTHDPYINRDFSLLPNGEVIPKGDEKRYIIHQMTYAEVRKFDVGMKPYSAFPAQAKIPAYIPLLSDLIDSVETFTTTRGLPSVIYNIELKSSVSYDSVYNAKPAALVDAVMKVVNSKKIGDRFYIQSFDYRPLKYIHKEYPEVPIGFLTGSKTPFAKNLSELGFKPNIYSPHYSLVTKELVDSCRQMKIKIVPWTVNTKDEMKALKGLGVDGIITDFPNYLKEIK